MVNKIQLMGFLKRKDVVAAASGVTGLVVGAGASYLVTKKRLTLKYEQIANDEIEQAKERYSVIYKEPMVVPDDILAVEGEDEEFEPIRIFPEDELKDQISEHVNTLAEVAAAEGNTPEAVVEEVRNVFRDSKSANSHFDYDVEVPKRTKEAPYIITEDEFSENEQDYAQGSLTFYEEDGVLADETDAIVEDDNIVGEENLRWGHGARSRDMVHVRNDRLEMEWEIVRSKGSFSKEVYGFDDEDNHLEHSSSPRRFRQHRDE